MGDLPNGSIEDDDGCVWLLCDGRPVDPNQYPDLHAMIGDFFGITDGGFRIPDLRGQFVRVLDMDSSDAHASANRDRTARKNVTTSTAPQASIGSTQIDGIPHDHQLTGWTRSLVENADGQRMTNGSGDPFAWTSTGGTAQETRPRNVALNFIIRATSGTAATTTHEGLPVGTVMYFAHFGAPDTNNKEVWYPCDGTKSPQQRFDSSAATHTPTPLFRVIDVYFGAGNLDDSYDLPDLRGYFIRGVNLGSGHDPDASSRMRGPTNGTLSLDNVGSTQSSAWATHFHVIPGVKWTFSADNADTNALKRDFRHDVYQTAPVAPTSGAVDLSRLPAGTPVSQGRRVLTTDDIRPYNTALTTSLLASSHSIQHLPIGAIVMYAGYDPKWLERDGDVWRICDGSTVDREKFPAYAKLFHALFDGSQRILPSAVCVPDLRGRFVRGLDPGGTFDVDVEHRSPMFKFPAGASRGGPHVTSLQGDGVGPHAHGLASLVDAEFGFNSTCIEPGSQGAGFTYDSGDLCGPETRPINIYLHYIVRIG